MADPEIERVRRWLGNKSPCAIRFRINPRGPTRIMMACWLPKGHSDDHQSFAIVHARVLFQERRRR